MAHSIDWSGVTDAHVTITDDDTTVRAMVTDAGVGFDIQVWMRTPTCRRSCPEMSGRLPAASS